MADYTDKICPYCKTQFLPEDEIVLCSTCDMPHHKDCWIENQGCTTFGCTGTIKSVGEGASSVTATQMQYEDTGSLFCTQCGKKNASGYAFCIACGSPLSAPVAPQPVYQPQPAYQPLQPSYAPPAPAPYQPQPGYQSMIHWQQELPEEDLYTLVGKNEEYYIPKFQQLKATGSKASWNWAAFLFTGYWLIYRKMYGYGAAVLVGAFLLSMIQSGVVTLLLWGVYIAAGIFGNSIYLHHLEGKLAQADALGDFRRDAYLEQNGGVNPTATILAVVGQIVLSAMLLL